MFLIDGACADNNEVAVVRCDDAASYVHYPAPENKSCFIYHNTTLVQQPIDHTNLTATLVADAETFLQTAVEQNKPFLYYMPFPQCIFGDQIREMDWAVGRVLASVASYNLMNNTIFFFSSDHGPHVELCLEGGTAAHLRGGKGDSSWEGGLRVPGIVFWPGVIQPRVETAVVSTMDVFATVMELAGGTMPLDKEMDGVSLVPLFTSGATGNGNDIFGDVGGGHGGVGAGEASVSPHKALFHYCGDVLMAIRYKQYKLRYYTEELPFDNVSTVHCTNGWAHGEFFQGGWTCRGGTTTTNYPPELLDIESDPAERYPLLSNQTWGPHLEWLGETRPSDSPLRDFIYYTDIGGIPNAQEAVSNNIDAAAPAPAAPAAPATSASTTPQCGQGSTTLLNGTILDGYTGQSLPAADEGNQAKLLADCEARCCADSNCSAFVVQYDSKNRGEPIGSCTEGKPCCWLVNQEHSLHPTRNNQSQTAVAGYPRGQPVPPPSPSPPGPPQPPPPAPIPPGYYAEILKEIDVILEDHLAKMQRGTIPDNGGNHDLTPCGGGGESSKKGETCTLNYPSQNIP
eukprot:gene4467-16338_t